jgi:hypothetical protein
MSAHPEESLPSHAASAQSRRESSDAVVLTVAELRSTISQLPAEAWIIVRFDQAGGTSHGRDIPARGAHAAPDGDALIISVPSARAKTR